MNNPFFNNNMAPPFGKSDISNQLIRDSYQYVVQSDTVTGVMYRINGDFLVNPIFASGLTIYTGFTFIDGNQQPGYVLTSDGSGNATWSPASAATPSSGVTSVTAISPLSASPTTGAVVITLTESYVPVGGGTMTGRLYNEVGITVTGDVTSDSVVTGNLSADTISATTLTIVNSSNITSGSITADTYSGNTIIVNNFTAVTVSATTYLNLPESADTKVTGFSLTNNVITLSQNRTDEYSAFTISLSAYTGNTSTSGDYLPLSGGTVTGNTIFQSGLTANTLNVTGNTLLSGLTAATISATTYYNLPVTADTFVTGFTLSSNTITLTQNRTDQYSAFTISLSAYTGSSSTTGAYLPLSGGTVTGGTEFTDGFTADTIQTKGDVYIGYSGGGAGLYINDGSPYAARIQAGNISSVNRTLELPDADGTFIITINNNGPDNQGNIDISLTGDYLPLSGGTVTGGTIFQSGVTANTISILDNLKIIDTSGGGETVTIRPTVGGISSPGRDIYLPDGNGTFVISLNGVGAGDDGDISLPFPFLRNKTNSGATDTITINQSIFNPSNLTVLSGSTFIIDADADYYVLGDLYNSGTTIVNGTLKVGGIIYNSGSITGSGIIE